MSQVALIFALVLSSLTQTPSRDEFDARIESVIAKRKTVGCAIAYSENGEVRFAKGYGFANIEHRVKMEPRHVHELASVSKQFTAVAILQLIEAKKLTLDDPLSKFFTGAHEDWKKVRIRHLLGHTGGLPDYLGALQGSVYKEFSDDQLAESIWKKPLKFEPGTKFEYCNSGYMLLGQIVAKVSGKSLGEYLQERVFLPAGMASAVWNDTRAIVPNRADGYSVRGSTISKEAFTSSSLSKTGDGMVMASALDLMKWDAALRAGKVLSAASQALMNRITGPSREGSNGGASGYGFGVVLAKVDGKLVQHHGGGWMGTSTFLARYVDEGKALTILCNTDGAPMGELIPLCEEKFLGRRVVSMGE
jgi:CubicO group peptidase (beta-lactamase class C family)